MDAFIREYGYITEFNESGLDLVKLIKVKGERDLFEAAAAGEDDRVWSLLKSGVSADAGEFKMLLYYASVRNITPLQTASANGHLKCVQTLINHGADVNAGDHFGVTALHMAAEKGHIMCLKALLDAGANCCLSTVTSKYPYRHSQHVSGTTALHLAAANNQVDCVTELIHCGADYNAIDEHGRTSLYIAAQAGFAECVLAHLRNAFGRDILSLPCFETANTPLHFAVRNNLVDCVRELLQSGSDVNHINRCGFTPLHIAVTQGNMTSNIDILKLLVLEGYNINVNLRDPSDFTPLHYTCFNKNFTKKHTKRPEMAKFLIAYGADVNVRNSKGFSLLECELKCSEEDYGLLSYIVRSILHLPRLESLYIHENFETPSRNARTIMAGTLNVIFGASRSNVEINGNGIGENYFETEDQENNYENENRENNYENEYREMEDEIGYYENEDQNEASEDTTGVNNQKVSQIISEKQLWYEWLSSNPRTLQHNCRYAIRNSLGSYRLKHIKSLPIPSRLQSYLLLEHGD